MSTPDEHPGATDKRQGRQQRLRELYAERAQPFLEAGEEIQAIFPAQIGMNPYLPLISAFAIFNKHVFVVATNKAIVVLTAKRLHPKELRERLPRDILLGPMSNNVGTALTLSPGLVVWVNRAHSVDVEAANAAIT